jgi:hypothetical protein
MAYDNVGTTNRVPTSSRKLGDRFRGYASIGAQRVKWTVRSNCADPREATVAT